MPQSCKDFVEHLATLARPAELKVVRLYSEGTVEEALLKAKYKKITQTCGKEGVVLVEDLASDVAKHIFGDNNKAFSNTSFSDSFEEDIAEVQSRMMHIDGFVQDNLIEKFDEITVFAKDVSLDAMLENLEDDDVEMDNVENDVDTEDMNDNVGLEYTPLMPIDEYSKAFLQNANSGFLQVTVTGGPAGISDYTNLKTVTKINTPNSPSATGRDIGDENNALFFYELQKKKSNPSYGFIVEETKIQYDDPKSIAFRQAMKHRIVDRGGEVDFNVYGPPNGDTWGKYEYPLYHKSELAKTVLAESKSKLSAKFFYPASEGSVSLETFKNQSRHALNATRKRTDFQNFVGNLNIDGSSGILESGRWAPWEDVIMKQAVASFGPNWHLIADMLNSNPKARGRYRSAAQCQNRLQKLNLQAFRGREYTKHQSIVSRYSWAAKPKKREDLLWNAPAPYNTLDAVEDNIKANDNGKQKASMGGGELPLKSLLVAATGIDRRQTIYNFENVLQAMNNQTDPPPILSEDVVRMTNEPSAAHDSHAEAAKSECKWLSVTNANNAGKEKAPCRTRKRKSSNCQTGCSFSFPFGQDN